MVKISVLHAIYIDDGNSRMNVSKKHIIKKSWREILLDGENDINTEDMNISDLQRKIIKDLTKFPWLVLILICNDFYSFIILYINLLKFSDFNISNEKHQEKKTHYFDNTKSRIIKKIILLSKLNLIY